MQRIKKTGNVFTIKNKETGVSFTASLSSDAVIDLVLMWMAKPENKKVQYEDLNVQYMKNVAKEMLLKHGPEIVQQVPPEIVVRRIDLRTVTRGMIEV